ncbi:MAG: PEGA domain-containing protein [Leptospirillum sp.]
MNPGRRFAFFLSTLGIFILLSACASQPVDLIYEPGSNQVQPKQYVSSLHFGFVTFEDDRMIPKGTGVKRMIGWGQPDTFIANVNIPRHVTESFVKQYRYLGFHATWIRTPPPNFSFSSRDWVRSLRLQYPNVNVFVIGKIKDYQFQMGYGGFIEGTGEKSIQAQSNIEAYFIDGNTGRFIWGDTIHHRTRGVVKDQPALIVAADKTESTLQRVILDFADRSVPHLAKVFPGAIRVTNNGMAAAPGTPAAIAPQAVNPNQSPIPSGKGRLVVSTTPAGGKVYIDGVYYGNTPILLDLPSGIHLLKVKMDGYHALRDKIGILEQKVTTWEERLHKKY